MSITIIETSQAPDAKPIGITKQLTTSWQTLVEVPSYEVPLESFGGGTIVVPGVAEMISPLLVTNLSPNLAKLSLRIYRASDDTYYTLANELLVPQNDILVVPINGQFIYTGDLLEATATLDSTLNATMSYTVGQAEEDDVV
jgi:hypothetical protein